MKNDHFYFVQKDGQTYALDKSRRPTPSRRKCQGFAYTDVNKSSDSRHEAKSQQLKRKLWLHGKKVFTEVGNARI